MAIPGTGTVSTRPRLGRVGDRASFEALARARRRGRAGALAVRFLDPAADPVTDPSVARVGFAVDRRAGSAVVRNRIRRRLRAGLRHLARCGDLPAGTYLVRAGVEVASQGWDALVDDLRAAVRGATGS